MRGAHVVGRGSGTAHVSEKYGRHRRTGGRIAHSIVFERRARSSCPILELDDPDRDGHLEWVPAPGRVERRDLVAPGTTLGSALPLLTFGQLSDMHVVDEESPIRTEFLDPWMGTAYRPQDGLTPQVLERMTAAVRTTRSPETGASAQLVITTGDNTDTGQRNELRWFIDLLDGGSINPDSGVRGTCGTAPDGPLYAGPIGAGTTWDPDASGSSFDDGPGYAANAADNLAAIGRPSALADYPGIFEAMNQPFLADGLGVPWYAAFGNHDVLVQGNTVVDPRIEALATGCTKVMSLPQATLARAGDAGRTGGRDGMLAVAFDAMTALAAGTSGAAGQSNDGRVAGAGALADSAPFVSIVPSDPDRVIVNKSSFIAEHFDTTGTPVGHGFTAWDLANGEGYYTFLARPGLRFVALDTVNEAGGHQGNIDDEQFRWLDGVLRDAEAHRELVVVFGHHPLASMVQPAPGAHFGLGPDGQVAPCSSLDPLAAPTADETVRCLLLRHRSVIAYICGHEHQNRIEPHPRPGGVPGGFWEIVTASEIEWPQQSRLIDIIDGGSTLLIATTTLDHDSPAMPDGDLSSISTLASIARELSFDDPQAHNGLDGTPDSRGTPADRDANLYLPDPYAGS